MKKHTKKYFCNVSLYELFLKNNGITIKNKKELGIKRGYVVGVKEINVVPIEDFTQDKFYSYIKVYKTIGFEIKNKKVYINKVKIYKNKYKALYKGYINAQISIWDIKNNKEIEL